MPGEKPSFWMASRGLADTSAGRLVPRDIAMDEPGAAMEAAAEGK
jgi:hypothetical protein